MAPRTSKGVRRSRSHARPKSSNKPHGKEIVGRLILVDWPSEGTQYTAIILSYSARYHSHNVLYLEDESTETLQLGTGPPYRTWTPAPDPSDELIGAQILLHDKKASHKNGEWFNFMRSSREKRGSPVYVIVFSHVEEPDAEEVTGPTSEERQFYRVMHEASEYLTTLDLAAIDYEVTRSLKRTARSLEEDNGAGNGADNHADNDDADNDDDNDAADVDAEYEVPSTSAADTSRRAGGAAASDNNYVDDDDDFPLSVDPREVTARARARASRKEGKQVSVIPDDENLPETLDDVSEPPSDADERRARSTDKPLSAPLKRSAKRAEAGADVRRGAYGADEREGAEGEGDVAGAMEDDDSEIEIVEEGRSPLGAKGGGEGRSADEVRSKGKELDGEGGVKAGVNGRGQVISRLRHGDEGEVTEDALLAQPPALEDEEAVCEVQAGAVAKEEGSRALSSSERNALIMEEDAGHDTASDEEKMGWAKRDMNLDQPPASRHNLVLGDYIELDMSAVEGNDDEVVMKKYGALWRVACIEAYLPLTDEHFVAFCDEKGGNMQTKLTDENHRALSGDEVAQLDKGHKRGKPAGRKGAGASGSHIRERYGKKYTADADVGVDVDAEGYMDVDKESTDDDEFEGVESARGHASSGGQDVGADEEVVGRRKGRGQGRLSGRVSKREGEEKTKPRKMRKRLTMDRVLGRRAGAEITSRCVKITWPGTSLVYVALVMGYSPEAGQHIVIYMVDHCVEVLELRYREWSLLEKGEEPWNSGGLVGKRLVVWWVGSYDDDEVQAKAEELFGDREVRVPFECYVLNYVGESRYKIVYPSNEDVETRELTAEKSDLEPLERDWDLLQDGENNVMGLPVIGWES